MNQVPVRLPNLAKENLDKARSAAIAAVASYNQPGPQFRTAQYLILITVGWTALFHAIFYKQRIRPWYRKRGSGTGRAIRYERIDGEPKHWELSECLDQYYAQDHPPERKNLDFIIGLRNKIEHRNLPDLDSRLYGECQASLLNFESLLVQEFGSRYALQEWLVVSLQMSREMPPEKRQAARTLAKGSTRSVLDYVDRFRGGLPSAVLSNQKYSYNVYLIPRVVGRENVADAAVQFVKFDDASSEELENLIRQNVLIKEKKVPVANLNLFKPGKVVEQVRARIPFRFTVNNHTVAWKYYEVRPAPNAPSPERTKSQYCVYDSAHRDYLYTKAWIEKLIRDLSDPDLFLKVIGRDPVPNNPPI